MNLAELIAEGSELRGQANSVGVAFLRAEADCALTFAQIALQPGDDPDAKSRNQASAWKAYSTIMRLRIRLTVPGAAALELEKKLALLESAFRQLAEPP